MPNRILRDWTLSDKIDSLSVNSERFFTRLIMKADDYGCFNADPRILKANLFPLKLDSIREADIIRWMTECHKADTIVLYEVSNKKYLQIKDFRQRLDKAKNKYPLPSDNDSLEFDTDFPAETETETEVEKKPKQNPKTASLDFIDSKDFIPVIEKWLEYKKSRRETYKSNDSIKLFCKKLIELSGNDIIKAEKIIEQSMAQNWAGIFELKNILNGTNTRANTTGNIGVAGRQQSTVGSLLRDFGKDIANADLKEHSES